MRTPAITHRDLISFLQALLHVSKEATGTETLFILGFIIAELELQEAYGHEVSLRDCERIIGSVSAAGRAYYESAVGGTDAVLPSGRE